MNATRNPVVATVADASDEMMALDQASPNPAPVTTTAEDAQEVAADLRKLIDSAPAYIWLDLGEGLEALTDEGSFRDLREVSWSEDNATGVGIKYVRAPVAVATSDAERDLAKIYDAFSIGSKARIIHILMENLSNVLRRERCLAAIERTFFMVPTEPEEEDDGVWGEECLLNWGQDPDEYVRTFREALKTTTPTESSAVFLVATGETHEGQETYTRHDVRPSLCDAETLYTAPSPALPIDFKQATDQGGWQLVPKKPTPAMLDAVMVDEVEAPEFLSLIRDQYAEDYCAMLAAAPTLLGVADGDAVGGKSGGASND